MTLADQLFEPWRPEKASLALEQDSKRYCPYNPQSLPLHFPKQDADTSNTNLPLFGSASGIKGDDLSNEAQMSISNAHDVVLHVGGPVWALDWCPSTILPPSTSKASATLHYLAIGCHPLYSQQNRIGVPVSGPGILQIWQIADPEKASKTQKHVPAPIMSLGIAHNGGFAWHCKWCPATSLTDFANTLRDGGKTLPRLGLVAATLSDGSINVWSVPHPDAAAQALGRQTSQSSSKASKTTKIEQPLIVQQQPVAQVSSIHLGGALPNVVDWLPVEPYDLLAVGCWDGSVAIIRLDPTIQKPDNTENGASNEQQNKPYGCEILAHFPADAVPLRAIKWIPPGLGSVDSKDRIQRHVFLTAGHEGNLKIWDSRYQFEPVYAQGLSTGVILDATWTKAPFGIMVAMEDSSVRAILLGSQDILANKSKSQKPVHSIGFRGTNAGGLWGIAAHPDTDMMAYVGEDGVVGCFSAEYWWDNRKRKPHDALGALKINDGVLSILSAEDLGTNTGLYTEKMCDRLKVLEALKGEILDELQSLIRVQWASGSRWVASGGGAGIVRCQWVFPS